MASERHALTFASADVAAKLTMLSNSLPDTLGAIVDADKNVVEIIRSLPVSCSLPGGLKFIQASKKDLLSLPAAAQNHQLHESSSKAIALRFRSSTLVSEVASPAIFAEIREAEVTTVDDIVLRSERCTVGDLSLVEERPAHNVQFYKGATAQYASSDPTTPRFWIEELDKTLYSIPIDAIAYVAATANEVDVKRAVLEAVDRQILTAITLLKDLSEDSFSESSNAVTIRHFPVLCNSKILSLIALCQSDAEDEQEPSSVERRKALHSELLLPLNRPLLRRSCALDFDESTSCKSQVYFRDDGGFDGRLADVHVGIKTHGLGEKGVTVHLVQGQYLYCHYMQDRCNDSGWGCAYRSLQTILSWCAFQGLATFPNGVLPSHRDIQRALVDVGDKASNFIGGREWIGANEVCYALQHLTGVNSKILHVSRGSEIESIGRELIRHFELHGSPVMIGGGVLAWTILGVARDTRTGKSRFLILDPHYEGRDELKTIQSKGWIAWKSADVFVANAFYNLCMPLRPAAF